MKVAKEEHNTMIDEIKENLNRFFNREKNPPIIPGMKATTLIIPKSKKPKKVAMYSASLTPIDI